MPVSSTVWCWSTSRSPCASRARSNAPWRATRSSMWSRKRIPVVTCEAPRPSRFRRMRISVSLVRRRIVAVLGIALAETLDFLQEALHLLLRADGDAYEAGTEFFGAFADENASTFELPKELRAIWAEISEDKIRGGRKRDDSEGVELLFEPGADALSFADIAAYGVFVADSSVGGDQGSEIDGKRRHGATQKSDGFGCSDNGAEAQRG